MQQQLNIIVISKLKYGDNDLIIKTYSRENGVVVFFAKNILKRRKGNIRASYFQILAQLQVEASNKPNQNLWNFREVKITNPYNSIYTNVYKSSIAMFLSEVLSMVLKEEESNFGLYQYLEAALQWLDQEQEFANFHLLFLLNLTKYLGFYPKFSLREEEFFNLTSGTFSDRKQDMYCVSGQDLTLLYTLKGTNFDALKDIKLSSQQRHSFLSMLLLYFELHLGDFRQPKSLEVFNQVFR